MSDDRRGNRMNPWVTAHRAVPRWSGSALFQRHDRIPLRVSQRADRRSTGQEVKKQASAPSQVFPLFGSAWLTMKTHVRRRLCDSAALLQLSRAPAVRPGLQRERMAL